jgi:transcription-repair coupling factor (superfamily II helicase)
LLDFSTLGAGFKIALHDLQIRGAGNLLGAAQSGQIAAVGYEMYVELMERAIQEIKGQEYVEQVEPEMVLGVAAFIPESYVPDTEARLVHYRRLSSAKGPVELLDVAEELKDRYGPPPIEVENLLSVMDIKNLLKVIRAIRLEVGQGGLTITFHEKGPAYPDRVMDLIRKNVQRVKLSPEGRLFLSEKGWEGAEGLERIKNLLRALTQSN